MTELCKVSCTVQCPGNAFPWVQQQSLGLSTGAFTQELQQESHKEKLSSEIAPRTSVTSAFSPRLKKKKEKKLMGFKRNKFIKEH